METQTLNISPVLQKILTKRGFQSDDIPPLFSWDLKELPSLEKMNDVDLAATRILEAIENSEPIGVYGDYDVDGTTSCALFYHFFKMLNIEVKLYQPSRFIEGYGLHLTSIDQAVIDNIKVLITVDCGISNVKEAEYAAEKNIDLIITDHHTDAAETMPPAYAIVNPNRRDEEKDSPLRVLAGVGVAFCICVKMREMLLKQGKQCPSLYPLLQFFAIGTISDLAKLTPMNLTMTRHGLKQLLSSQYAGLRTFFTQEELDAAVVLSDKVSFNIGPMINSKGRLDHPELALQLLTTDSSDLAYHYHSQLVDCNNERKSIQSKVYKSAQEQIEAQVDENHKISIAYSADWHEGVIGIVASRLVESYKTPAIVFTDTEEKGVIKASARTAGDLSIFDCLKQCEDLFMKFGGHKAAAGLSMKKENLPAFKERINAILAGIPYGLRVAQESYDLEIEVDDIDYNLVKSLEMLEPYGQGNPKPTFKLINARLDSFKLLKEVHVKWFFSSQKVNKKLQGISFNHVGAYETPHPDFIFENQNELNPQYICTLGINRFRGNETIQLMVKKVILN